MLLCKFLLDFTIVIDFSLFGIDEQNFSWLEPAFLCDFGRFEIHHSHFRRHNHGIVVRDGVARRTQSVSVEHTPDEPPIREKKCRRSVPRLHKDGMVFVERLEVLTDWVLVVEALRHENRHGMWERET